MTTSTLSDAAYWAEINQIKTAYHEAGHAVAYWSLDLPILYITIDPEEESGCYGLVAVPERSLSLWDLQLVTSAGPIAQSILEYQLNQPSEDGEEWDVYFVGALLTGGSRDRERAMGALDDDQQIDSTREWVALVWPFVTVLAEALLIERTLSGAEAWQILGDAEAWIEGLDRVH